MAITKVVLAKLSPTMEEGTVVKWNKQEGDAIKVGDVLAEIETDKANMEMEALGAGILRKVLVPAGGKAPVGALIGVIAEAAEDIGALLAAAASTPAPAAAPSPAPAPAAPPPSAPQPVATAAPPPPAPAPATMAPPATALPAARIKASPLARSIAAQHNIPIHQVPGSGPGGRVIKRDVEAWSRGAPPAAAAAAAVAAPMAPPVPSVV
ncbi:MAG TPA: biotin/lipoyl-containing protein, partial [Vicinamibacteria bacterium]|nr:biotin/lipoyl-containing protein [Vicinamibacteria bacterium]